MSGRTKIKITWGRMAIRMQHSAEQNSTIWHGSMKLCRIIVEKDSEEWWFNITTSNNMTLSMKTFGIMSLGIMTLCKMTLGIMTLGKVALGKWH